MLPFDLADLIKAVGYVGLFGIVFAESGLFFGFFLPGDSLLFTAGSVAARFPELLNLPTMIVLLSIAAIAGDSVGYWSGEKFGRRLFTNEQSFWRNPKRLEAAHDFYEKHGGKAIVLARFIPVVRTLAPIVAGMSSMRYRRFAAFNVLGGVLWAIGLTTAGYVLGRSVPDIDRYLLPIIAAIVVLSALPTLIHVWRDYRHEILGAARRRVGRQPSAGGPDR